MARTFLLIPLLVFALFGCAPPAKQLETKFYPELPIEPRMQFLTTISNEGDIGKTTSGMRAFVAGEDALRGFSRPYAIASRPGTLYVSDVGFNMVIVVDFANKEFRPLPSERATALRQPRGLTVAEDILYVADSQRRQVLAFDSEDKYLRLYGGAETLEQPLDVAVYGDRVYVVDHSAYNIKVFDRETGELQGTIGERGREEGQLDRPTHVRVDHEGNLYVTDSLNFRVQKFDAEGNFIHMFGYPGSTPGGFARPKGIDVTRDGYLYAVDAAFENVQIFHDPSQFLVFFFGGFGHAPSYMYLPSPLTISYENIDLFKPYFDKDFKVEYLVYVGNQLGDYKINVYGVGKWIGPPLN
ncbi:hypothetical protein [Pelovirga terrestris]|uniref:6-bladed beta-propeller n=1 Tax=Pelovirga terrestris TaxID=2771352 RepID=A0A8J6QYD9_9BACT|nr:hypothetical protein [Pelovirga terrestris]MBD1400677.1 hypothetical protein [Pelovirga terrestris]